MRRRRWLLALLLFVLLALAIGASGELEESEEREDREDWELREESDGIRVFTRDSSLPVSKTLRAETIIRVPSFDSS